MDHEQFETLARQMAGGEGNRRTVIRLLAGGALAGLQARLGLTQVAMANVKRKSTQKRRSDQKPHGTLLATEKQRKKRRKKRAVQVGCGAEQRLCGNGSCIAQDQCCPGQRQCSDGRCLSMDQCCPEATPPVCGGCAEPACDHGELVCHSTCEFEGAECCNGHCLTPCLGGQQRNPQNCQCECPDSGVLLEDQMTCCPRDQACFFHDGWPMQCCGEGYMCVGGNLCT